VSEQNLYSQIAGQIAPIKDRQEIAYVINGLKAGKVNKSWLPIIMIGNFGNVISSPDS
jgi:hypothetical protein